MKSLKKALHALTLTGVLLGVSCAFAAENDAQPLPAAAPDSLAVARRCAPLVDKQAATWGDATRWQLIYLWRSKAGSAFEFEPTRNYGSEQYCSRLHLLREDGSLIDATTMLCMVSNRGTPTEVWSFGNQVPAAGICPLSADGAAAIDRKAPVLEDVVHKVAGAARPARRSSR